MTTTDSITIQDVQTIRSLVDQDLRFLIDKWGTAEVKERLEREYPPDGTDAVFALLDEAILAAPQERMRRALAVADKIEQKLSL